MDKIYLLATVNIILLVSAAAYLKSILYVWRNLKKTMTNKEKFLYRLSVIISIAVPAAVMLGSILEIQAGSGYIFTANSIVVISIIAIIIIMGKNLNRIYTNKKLIANNH